LLALAAFAASRGAWAGHCREHSSVVGHKSCGGFGGGWTHPWLENIEIGYMGGALVVEHLSLPRAVSDTVYDSSGPARLVTTFGARGMWTVGARSGLRWHSRHVVAGLEGALATSVGSQSAETTLDGGLPMTGGTIFTLEGALYGGAHRRVGQFDLIMLGLVGVRDIEVAPPLPPGYTECMGGVTGKGCAVLPTAVYGFAGVRAGVEMWMNRNFTVGVSAGMDLTDRAESFAIELHSHLVPYDGL
jgi:hypothetical protein